MREMDTIQNIVVVGAQWGDEGKGKIVDWLSEKADVVARFQGGHNAGHTLVVDGTTYKLSAFPSGIVRPDVLSVIGNGCVVDYRHIQKEYEKLVSQGVSITPDNFLISEDVTLILPTHPMLDAFYEKTNGIGTTKKGIGPAYEDKVARRALRIADLSDDFSQRLYNTLEHHARILAYDEPAFSALREITGKPIASIDEFLDCVFPLIHRELLNFRGFIAPFVGSSWATLRESIKEGSHIMFEGAQGVLLDIDHGTYPYVTSSNTVASSAASGTGVGMGDIDRVLGIAKAYTTRVGNGIFPTEIEGPIGKHIRDKGHEYGTVTGRERRCGWFDVPMMQKAVQISGITDIALMKIDVLDELDFINVCVGYELIEDRNGTPVKYPSTHIPSGFKGTVRPVYETFPGWKCSTEGINDIRDLPEKAVLYIEALERYVGVPIAIISTSPRREDTIIVSREFSHYLGVEDDTDYGHRP